MSIPRHLFHPRHLPSWLALGFLRLLALLPLNWLHALSGPLGKLMAKLLGRRRRIVQTNARLCFPDMNESEKKQFVEAVFASSIMGAFETIFSWWADDRRIQSLFTIEGSELIEQARRDQRGILLLGLHLTTLDLAGRMMRLCHDVDVTYRKQNDPVFDHFIVKNRARLFTNMIEKREMRRMIRVLKEGRMVWYAIDQNYGQKNFVFAPLFGQQAATLAGTGKILKLTGTKPLLFSHYRIKKDGRLHYLLKVTDPFADNFSDDEADNAVLLNQAYERAIRQQPEQYMWTHRRFKTRPVGEPPLYEKKRKKAPGGAQK